MNPYCAKHEWPAGMGKPCPDCEELNALKLQLREVEQRDVDGRIAYNALAESYENMKRLISEIQAACDLWNNHGCGAISTVVKIIEFLRSTQKPNGEHDHGCYKCAILDQTPCGDHKSEKRNDEAMKETEYDAQ